MTKQLVAAVNELLQKKAEELEGIPKLGHTITSSFKDMCIMAVALDRAEEVIVQLSPHYIEDPKQGRMVKAIDIRLSPANGRVLIPKESTAVVILKEATP